MTEQSNPERAEVLTEEEIASIARACKHGRAVQLASQTVRRLLAQLAAQSKLIAEREAREMTLRSCVRVLADSTCPHVCNHFHENGLARRNNRKAESGQTMTPTERGDAMTHQPEERRGDPRCVDPDCVLDVHDRAMQHMNAALNRFEWIPQPAAEPVKPQTCERYVSAGRQACGNPLPCKDHPRHEDVCAFPKCGAREGAGRHFKPTAPANHLANHAFVPLATPAEDELAADHPPEFYAAAREAMQFKPLLAFEMGWNARAEWDRSRR